ncbi:phosphoglycolate phosphatase [Ruminiclostridium hungatei]|uniref:Phosphoglycolate phosphatase n=1 Tax=Ruminiclostridium hungatei TaxID=48256 RepID=A0A1V4SFX5_RUMHU|nr:HAD family hydrolase [Ruminiclostridium hungatei]OPX42789.1 phosphoglycolate phosphatase [Ruminiclostridium hungatei]
MKRGITQWHMYDDTIPCLEIAKSRGYVNVIVSNHVPELAQLVKALGLGGYFRQVYSSADLGFEKPNIQIYRKVLSMFSDINEVTMIGDSYPADILGAKNAGINAVLVRAENTYNYQYYCKNLNGVFNILVIAAKKNNVGY